MISNLFEVLTEGYPKAAFPVVEHLTCHQRVEKSCACQWDAEVEAKQPPVLSISIELQENTHMLESQFNCSFLLLFYAQIAEKKVKVFKFSTL